MKVIIQIFQGECRSMLPSLQLEVSGDKPEKKRSVLDSLGSGYMPKDIGPLQREALESLEPNRGPTYMFQGGQGVGSDQEDWFL